MSSVSSKPIIDRLIACNGCFEDDPPVDAIIEYTSVWGSLCWKLIYHAPEAGRVVAETMLSAYVINPKLIWTRDRSKENTHGTHD